MTEEQIERLYERAMDKLDISRDSGILRIPTKTIVIGDK